MSLYAITFLPGPCHCLITKAEYKLSLKMSLEVQIIYRLPPLDKLKTCAKQNGNTHFLL